MNSGDPMEKGLAEAFGARGSQPRPSVLQILQGRTNSKLGLLLESTGPEDAPVQVTDELKELRDPSGRYQLLGEIGRGGVGVVYKGRDQDLGRDVAMKVLRDEYARRPDVLARFVEEAQIGGQLQHPGIVPVYELGLQAGERPYFAMKLVKGETLAAHLARRDHPTTQRRRLLGIFEQVCQTIAYAHARRVVHRDLKPANVMIGAFGEVQVVDWGFAKVLPRGGVADEAESVARASEKSVIETVRSQADAGSHSVAGSMLGTPAYMPPEQALGDIARLDERSDVFALGAVLCEILTGEPPYREADGDVVHQAAGAALDGAHARLATCDADQALVTLCAECLSPARRARPESAAEVAERVGEHLTSVEERAQQAEVRAAEARYQHRVTLLSAAAVLVVLAVGTGSWLWMERTAQERRAQVAARVAAARNAASTAIGKAQAAGQDLGAWTVAVAAAGQLVALAGTADIDAATRRDAESLQRVVLEASTRARAAVDLRARNAAMRARLENLRVPTDDDIRQEKWVLRDAARIDAEYAKAFTDYLGASLHDLPAAATLARLRGSGIEEELAASLDHWGLERDTLAELGGDADPAGTALIREVTARLDPEDSWRVQLRALLPIAKQAGSELKALAAEADCAQLSAASCRVLSQALGRAGETAAVLDVLRRAQEAHPQDFDLCFRLGVNLELGEVPDYEAAVATYRIVHALRPEQKEVLHRQGLALQAMERHADALRVFRRLRALDPADSHWHNHVGTSLMKSDRAGEATAEFRKLLAQHPDHGPAWVNLGMLLQEQDRDYTAAQRAFDKAAAAFGTENPYWASVARMRARVCRSRIRVCEGCLSGRVTLSTADGWSDAIWHGYRHGRLREVVTCTERTRSRMPGLVQGQGAGLYNAACSAARLAAHEAEVPNQAERARLRGLARAWLAEEAAKCRRWIEEGESLAMPGRERMRHALADAAFAGVRGDQVVKLRPSEQGPWRALWSEIEQLGRAEIAAPVMDQAAAAAVGWPRLSRLYDQARYQEVVGLCEDALAHRRRWLLDQPGRFATPAGAAARAAAADPDATQGARLRGLARNWLARATEEWRSRLRNGGPIAVDTRASILWAQREMQSVRGEGLAPLPAAEADAWRTLWSDLERMLMDFDAEDPAELNRFGSALDQAGRVREAGGYFAKAIARDPDFAPAHFNLGQNAGKLGDLRAALRHVRRAQELWAEKDTRYDRTWGGRARQHADRCAARIAKLETIVRGERLADSNAEWSEAVYLEFVGGNNASVVALAERTLRDEPALALGAAFGLYNAACAAARLARADGTTAAEAKRVRTLARHWLERDVQRRLDLSRTNPELTSDLRGHLRHVLQDADFANFRDDALAELPAAEAEAWRRIWHRIADAAGR